MPRKFLVYSRPGGLSSAPDAVTATQEGLLRDGFGPNPLFHCLIAERGGQPAGFALYSFNYSTWVGRPGIYVEDLFVQPALRGLASSS